MLSAKRLFVGTMGLALTLVLEIGTDQPDPVGVAIGVESVPLVARGLPARLLSASPVWHEPHPGSLAQGTRLV